MKCQTCGKAMTGRKRKYCAPSCRKSYVKPKLAKLVSCQYCGKELEQNQGRGRGKRNCSRECRSAIRTAKLKVERQIIHKCEICTTNFESGKKHQRFCSNDCRQIGRNNDSKIKRSNELQELYPDGMRTEPCGWCGEPRTFDYRLSTPTAYHPKCTKEAQSARYRIKTVKRQKVSSRYRISHEQIVREHGSDCHICKQPIDLELPRTHRYGLTADHLIPLSKNGTDDMSNLRPAHWICNIKKSDKIMESNNA